jgi:hypothetical protein
MVETAEYVINPSKSTKRVEEKIEKKTKDDYVDTNDKSILLLLFFK